MKLTQNILVPTDFSHAADLALDAAIVLAKQNSAKLTLVHVLDPTPFALGATGLGEIDHKELEPEVEQKVHEALAKIRDERLSDLPEVKTALVLSKNAADGIVHYAQKEGADMIVMSTHGRSGLAHLLIGSVAEKVVRHSTCPVLTLRSKAKD